MRYALIDKNNIVKNVIVLDNSDQWSPPDDHYIIHDKNNNADINWKYDGEKFIPTEQKKLAIPPSLNPPTKQELTDYVNHKRIEIENGGVMVDNIKIASDLNSRLQLSLLNITGSSINFKLLDNRWTTINKDQLNKIKKAVATHVQACVDTERNLHDLIDNGKINTYADIESFDWPKNQII